LNRGKGPKKGRKLAEVSMKICRPPGRKRENNQLIETRPDTLEPAKKDREKQASAEVKVGSQQCSRAPFKERGDKSACARKRRTKPRCL